MTSPSRADAAVRVRPAEARDAASWRSLWDGYCAFYRVELPATTTERTWARILDPGIPVHAIVAENDQQDVIGFANYVLHENTWESTPVCYLEDLFVAPDARAVGVGKALIDWLVEAMQAQGWSRLYWMTREDNYRARGLYDKYTRRDAFVRYVVMPVAH